MASASRTVAATSASGSAPAAPGPHEALHHDPLRQAQHVQVLPRGRSMSVSARPHGSPRTGFAARVRFPAGRRPGPDRLVPIHHRRRPPSLCRRRAHQVAHDDRQSTERRSGRPADLSARSGSGATGQPHGRPPSPRQPAPVALRAGEPPASDGAARHELDDRRILHPLHGWSPAYRRARRGWRLDRDCPRSPTRLDIPAHGLIVRPLEVWKRVSRRQRISGVGTVHLAERDTHSLRRGPLAVAGTATASPSPVPGRDRWPRRTWR